MEKTSKLNSPKHNKGNKNWKWKTEKPVRNTNENKSIFETNMFDKHQPRVTKKK